jgi:hypothetical protein
MREQLLGVMSVGIFDHTIAAFWQYILYFEILVKLREYHLPKAKYSMAVLQKMQQIESQFQMTSQFVAADFTGRLDLLVRNLLRDLKRVPGGKTLKEYFTNMVFEDQLPALRDAVVDLSSDFDRVVLYFDNLDKGWPSTGIETADIRTIRHLIDALNKIQRELTRREIEFEYLVFLRSDVYEQLVEETADRGKYNAISVDTSDRQQLERIIRERVIASVGPKDAEQAWKAINPLMPDGTSAIETMITNSLMRPRFLIDLCEASISNAINRGHDVVDKTDVETGLENHSIYLVRNFGYEIRDVSGISDKIFYEFLGLGTLLTEEEVFATIRKITDKDPVEVVSLLIWYGFLGFPVATTTPFSFTTSIMTCVDLKLNALAQAQTSSTPSTRHFFAASPNAGRFRKSHLAAARMIVRSSLTILFPGLAVQLGMSALGQKRTFTKAVTAVGHQRLVGRTNVERNH